MSLPPVLAALAPLTGLLRLRRRLARQRAVLSGEVAPARTPCPLCGGTQFDLVQPILVSALLRCRGCRLVAFNPLPTPAHLARYYSTQQGYLPSIELNLRSFEADRSLWQDKTNHRLSQLRAHDPLASGAHLLDVGCAYGFFVQLAAGAGLATHGLEISTATSAAARARGLDVRTGTLADRLFPAASMHAICFDNVLEHCLDPLADLRQARALLAPGGLLFVAVPNHASLVARRDGPRWKMLSWPNHLYYFTRETLVRMVAAAGFDVLDCFTQQGESDPADDRRVIRALFGLEDRERIERCLGFLQELGLGQELVVVARAGRASDPENP